MKNITVKYNGPSGVTVKAYNKHFNYLIDIFYNVQHGDELHIAGFDSRGRLDSKTYLKIGSASYKIHTSCSVDILGDEIGPFEVIEYTDGEGYTCSLDDQDGGDLDDSCEANAADGGGHAMWLSAYSDAGVGRFFFENGAGSFQQFDDGTATLTGTLVNEHDDDDRWDIEFFFSDKMSWSEWSALGRDYKDEANLAGSSYQFWSYYIMDPDEDSKLIGRGHNAGQEKIVDHRPSDFEFGFQLGTAANNKNPKYGFSGWFSYRNFRGHWVQGDINVDIENCSGSNGDICSGEVEEWDGNIQLCYNGESICVAPDRVQHYLNKGATLGNCESLFALNGGAEDDIHGIANTEDDLGRPVVEINAYPNPTSDFANITFNVNKEGPVSVGVYNMQGVLMGQLFEGEAKANEEYTVSFDGSNVLGGVYLIRLRTAGYIETRKLMIRK